MKVYLGHLGTILLVILLAMALVAAVAPLFGWRLDVVQSGSMAPAIGVGDLVVTSPVPPKDIHPGDVVSFHSANGVLVCHRVVSMDQANGTLCTKGDANQHQDLSPVPFQDVVGKVAFSVPVLGYFIDFLKSPFGWALIVLLALLVLLLGSGKGAEGEKAGEDRP